MVIFGMEFVAGNESSEVLKLGKEAFDLPAFMQLLNQRPSLKPSALSIRRLHHPLDLDKAAL